MINYLMGAFRSGTVLTQNCYAYVTIAEADNGQYKVTATVYSDPNKSTVLKVRSDIVMPVTTADESQESKELRALSMFRALAPEMKLISES